MLGRITSQWNRFENCNPGLTNSQRAQRKWIVKTGYLSRKFHALTIHFCIKKLIQVCGTLSDLTSSIGKEIIQYYVNLLTVDFVILFKRKKYEKSRHALCG